MRKLFAMVCFTISVLLGSMCANVYAFGGADYKAWVTNDPSERIYNENFVTEVVRITSSSLLADEYWKVTGWCSRAPNYAMYITTSPNIGADRFVKITNSFVLADKSICIVNPYDLDDETLKLLEPTD